MQIDRSNGWEAVAARFIGERSAVGAATVRSWCRALPQPAAVLDLGCGAGVPITQTLLAEGCAVSGVDASPTLLGALQQRFPTVPVACEAVEESGFFARQYEGIVAVGLLFLLEPDVQQHLILRIGAALKPSGRFLFSAPVQAVSWADSLTARESVSLGEARYRRVLAAAGLTLVGEFIDEGGNHYYDAVRETLRR